MGLKAWGPSTRGGPSEQMTLVEPRPPQACVPQCDCHPVEGKVATLSEAAMAIPPASWELGLLNTGNDKSCLLWSHSWAGMTPVPWVHTLRLFINSYCCIFVVLNF